MVALFELMFSSIGGILSFAGTVFWIIMMIDCLRSSSVSHKGRWMIFMLITNWVGAVVYFFVIRPDILNRLLRYLRNTFGTQQRFWTSAPPVSSAPHYAPPPNEAYREYQQGYTAQSYQPNYTATPTAQPAYAPEQPSYYQSYEQPQASYPEMPPMQQ